MWALVALELEFLVAAYAHFTWFDVVPTVPETLEFGGEGQISECIGLLLLHMLLGLVHFWDPVLVHGVDLSGLFLCMTCLQVYV